MTYALSFGYLVRVLGILLFLLVGTPTGYSADDAIVAIVNDEVITYSDLKDYISAFLVQLKSEGRDVGEIQSMMGELKSHGIERLIDDRLIITEANRKGVEVKEKVVADRLREIREKYPSEQDFLKALMSAGITVTDLKNKITDQLKVTFLVDDEVRSKIFVNPQEVTEYFKSNFERYQFPPSVELESIFVSSKEDKEAGREKAGRALGLLNSGKDFSDVAKEFSEAPSVGVITKGQLLPIIENTVFQLKDGSISDVIAVENGFYIFRMKRHIPAKMAQLEDVKKEITELLFEKKFQERLQSWLDNLTKNAYIEIKG